MLFSKIKEIHVVSFRFCYESRTEHLVKSNSTFDNDCT